MSVLKRRKMEYVMHFVYCSCLLFATAIPGCVLFSGFSCSISGGAVLVPVSFVILVLAKCFLGFVCLVSFCCV
jgi:hypothetical protein